MKLVVSTTLTAIAIFAGSAAFADDPASRYKDLYELKQLHVDFHHAVSHAGVNSDSKAQALAEVLALWTDDGDIVAGGVTYSGKGTPATPSCAPGSLTVCDFFANHAGSFVLGRDWVSLTPIFTEAITVLDGDKADIYFQCIYLDENNNDARVSNVTFGLPGQPDTGRATKVHGRWLFSHVESEAVPSPTLDVYQ